MDLTAEETRLARLSVPELQREYAGLTGEAVRSRHRGYLTRRILWWLQARAYGGLSERARSLAASLARDGDIRLTPPRRPAPLAHGVPKPRDTRLPRPGRTIERVLAAHGEFAPRNEHHAGRGFRQWRRARADQQREAAEGGA